MKVGPFAWAYYAILEEPTRSSRGASSGATDPIALVAETWRSWLAVSDLNAAFAAVTQLSRLIPRSHSRIPLFKVSLDLLKRTSETQWGLRKRLVERKCKSAESVLPSNT